MFTIFPLEAHVKIISIVSCLHINWNTASLARNGGRLNFFTRNDDVSDIFFFVLMTLKATVTGNKRTLATMITALQGPFDGSLAWIK